jgi:MOSC domain-containing protein YiiM
MAILLIPLETIEELQGEGWPIKPGDIGENFTTEGIPYSSFAPESIIKSGRP